MWLLIMTRLRSLCLGKKDELIPDTVENTDNGADSVAVIAADKFAFMSKKQKDASFEKYDNESMIKDEDFDEDYAETASDSVWR